MRHDTGARIMVLLLALVTTATTFAVFVSTTLKDEPATMTAFVVIVGLAIVLDLVWKGIAHRRLGYGAHAIDETPGTVVERRHPVGSTPGAA